jgi:hypothetical protein
MGAYDEIRVVEARRMLGILDPAGLADRATGWLSAGVVSPSLELLAATADASPDEALRLVRAAAVELDLTFATTQAARAFYVNANLPSLTSAEGFSGIAEISNGVTDAFEARLRRLFRRRRP